MNFARVIALAAIASVVVVSVIAGPDPCALPANVGNAWIGTPQTLKNCFTSVPVQLLQAKNTVAAQQALIDLYSFTDMAANSGAPYNLQVDLRSLLATVQSKLAAGSYGSDYEFQSDLMNMMNPLFDAHTLYRAPKGYQCFMIRPFNIEAAVDNSGNMEYTLRPGPLGQMTAQIWQTVFNFDVTPYVDQVVTGINGLSVTDHLMVVAQNFISTYKDHGVRYNAALRQRWAQTLLSMFPVTDSNLDFTSTMTFADGSTVSVPNAGFCGGGGINSTDVLLARNKFSLSLAEAQQQAAAINPKQLLVQGIDVHREIESLWEEAVASLPHPVIQARHAKLNRNSITSEEVLADPELSARAVRNVLMKDYRGIKSVLGNEFHSLPLNVPVRSLPSTLGGNPWTLTVQSASKAGDTFFMKFTYANLPPTWVLKLTTFAPADVQDTLNVIQALIQDGQANAGQNLILDVAYNGGGIICLSDLLLALLVPEWGSLQPSAAPTVPYGIYDYKQSQSALALRSVPNLNDAFTSFKNYLDIGTEHPSNVTFYTPILRQRGGFTSNYTQQAYFPAGCVGYPGGSFHAIPYYFPKLTVLTDGTCGSACALFASQLQSEKLARVVSYGGPTTRTVPLSTASFAGGNVLEYNTVSLMAFLQGNGAKGLPPMMTSSAASRFNFNEYYELTSMDVPREFLKRPADVHLDFYATFYADNPNTGAGLTNSAALYAAVVNIH